MLIKYMKNITIIGAGVMGTVMLGGVKKSFYSSKVSVADSDYKKLLNLKKKFKQLNIFCGDNLSAVKNTNCIILAVKPQSFLELSKELRGHINHHTVVISIMAGVPIKKIQNLLGLKKVVRAMPNLGARISRSMTVWLPDKSVKKNELKYIAKLFASIGREIMINNEILIDKATAVSGSGPGFFFAMIESWIKAAVKLGFSPKQAQELVFTTTDAANALLQLQKDPTQLRLQVTSKKGTTEAGLKEMMNGQIDKIWNKVLTRSYRRACELSK